MRQCECREEDQVPFKIKHYTGIYFTVQYCFYCGTMRLSKEESDKIKNLPKRKVTSKKFTD